MNEDEIRNYLLNTINSTHFLVQDKIHRDDKKFNKRNDFYRIKKYLDNFIEKINDDKFIVMPGLRGVGKTTLLYQFYDYLVTEHNIKYHQILYLNLNRLKDKGKIDLLSCFDIFIKDINDEAYINKKPLFIFVDEAHYTSNWGLVGKITYDETSNVFTIFSGSNALTLNDNPYTGRRALKREINPINFSEYLYLKYYCEIPQNMKEAFIELIFHGNITEFSKIERYMQLNNFMQLKREVKKEWEIFMKYGGLPYTLNKGYVEAKEYTLEVKDEIVERDLPLIKSHKKETLEAAHPLLDIIALQKPGTLSEEKLSKNLGISKTAVRELLQSLTKSLIIFNITSYGSASKQERSRKEYYYWSTQIKAAIFENDGGSNIRSLQEIKGVLLENYVAYSLYRLKVEYHYNFSIHFDPRKSGVDFLIKTINGNIIPIEVGIGKKNKRQITSAIDYYKSEYGIVISDTTSKITKEDNIIFVPYITFTLF
ncbi:MAG: ATP-binding protein [Methanosphaera sp.]|nr:ATP-binding protein [Methanosphaera sp.]